MFVKEVLLTLSLFTAFSAFAGFNGEITFSKEEVQNHLENIAALTSEAEQCLKQDFNRHQEFYKKYGISAFYGQNSAFSKLSEKEKRDFLVSKKLDPKLLEEIAGTSCIGLTLKCLERGFKITNQTDVYKKLRTFVAANGVDGSSLQHGLQKLGWKTLYWNPNPGKNALWDFQEKIADPRNKKHFRGFHAENYAAAVNKKRYFLNSVDDITSLVGFESTEPALLKSVPFFVGTAHMGYHVFPGAYGVVVEGHSSRAITDEKTIESAPFNPLDNNGAPSGRYRSGMISIPPTMN
jgi:hypothetical protein